MTKIPPLGFGHLFISRKILKVRKTPPWGFAHLRLSRSRFETVCAQHERRELVKTSRLRFKFSKSDGRCLPWDEYSGYLFKNQGAELASGEGAGSKFEGRSGGGWLARKRHIGDTRLQSERSSHQVVRFPKHLA